ncbi:hypothetical protein G9A89_014475 [Geosiphon pyriformis]|nr:hypothetical protein G9A89_014475 [Geosiphon pyriformis]
MVLTKIKEMSSKEIRIIKNNSPEPIKLNWGPNSDIVLDPINSEQFHEHYQKLASTREKQKQHLEQLNTQLLAQLVSVENRKKLGITAREISGFGSMNKINIPVNMTEEEIVNKREIISIYQPISILLYDQYILTIEKKVRNQAQIFKTEPTICKSEEIGLTNLYIPVKNYHYIKISIYNITGNVITSRILASN